MDITLSTPAYPPLNNFYEISNFDAVCFKMILSSIESYFFQTSNCVIYYAISNLKKSKILFHIILGKFQYKSYIYENKVNLVRKISKYKFKFFNDMILHPKFRNASIQGTDAWHHSFCNVSDC